MGDKGETRMILISKSWNKKMLYSKFKPKVGIKILLIQIFRLILNINLKSDKIVV